MFGENLAKHVVHLTVLKGRTLNEKHAQWLMKIQNILARSNIVRRISASLEKNVISF